MDILLKHNRFIKIIIHFTIRLAYLRYLKYVEKSNENENVKK